jgi:hypothetical protein
MYPQAPRSHRPTNYYWILLLCMAAMLVFLFIALRQMAGRFSTAGADQGSALVQAPLASAKPFASVVPQATATVASSAASASPAASPTASDGIVDVEPKELTDSPATYRSRVVRVHGTIFYSGKLDNGKTWIQVVGADNTYVDGQSSEPLPSGVTKGSDVIVTGIGAGLTNITAVNGKDYDQAYIDPVQKIELVR